MEKTNPISINIKYIAIPPMFWWNEYSDFCPDKYPFAIVGKFDIVYKEYQYRGGHDNFKPEYWFDNLEDAIEAGKKMHNDYYDILDNQYPRQINTRFAMKILNN